MDNPNSTDTQRNDSPAPATAPGPATVQDLAATMGAASPTNAQDPVAQHRKDVNDGRLRKATQDLEAANARIKELEAQIAKAGAGKPMFDAERVKKLSANPDEVADDYAEATAGALNAVVSDIRKEVQGQFDQMRAEVDASRKAVADARVNDTLAKAFRAVEGAAPGLVSRIARGDLKDRWEEFLDTPDPFSGLPHRDILSGAMKAGRAEAAQEVYARFVRDAGLSGQYGGVVTAPPRGAAPASPRIDVGTGASRPIYESKSFLEAQYVKTSQDVMAGRVSREDGQKRLEEIKSAIAEKRYAKP